MARNLIGGFLSIFSARVATSVISIVSLPLIVRVLEPSGYGDYAFLLSVLSLLLVLISSGVTEGIQKFAAENHERDSWEGDVVGFYVRLAVLLAGLGAGIVFLAAELGIIDRVFGGQFTLEFQLLALLLVIIQFRQLSRRALMAFDREHHSEPLRVVKKVLTVGVGVTLAAVGFGVVGMLVGIAVGNAVVALVGLALVFRRVPLRCVVRPLPEGFPRRELVSFNVLNVVLVVLTMSLYHVDVIMIQTFLGSERTGYYRAALAIAEYLWFVPISLQALLLHSTSELWNEGARERITELATRITRYTLLFVSLLAIGIAALANRFVPLYFGADYAPVVVPLLWLLPGTVGFAVAQPIIAISQGNGALRPLVAATGFAAVLNATLNLLLIPRYGLLGAATATSVGYGSMLLLHVASARYIGFDPLDDVRLGRIVATTAVTAGVVFSLARLVPGDVLALVVVPPLGFLTQVGVGIRTGAVRTDDVDRVLSWLPTPLPSLS